MAGTDTGIEPRDADSLTTGSTSAASTQSIALSRPLRLRIGVGAGIVLALAAVVVAVLVTLAGGGGASEVIESSGSVAHLPGSDPSSTAEADQSASSSMVFVHVFGAVVEPGLYELRQGSRVIDVVSAAGGFTEDAERDRVNLARVLLDGEQLGIPRQGEDLPMLEDGSASGSGVSAGTGGDAPAAAGAKVSLNRASASELQALPHVGPATAQSIIDWRTQNGPFTTVEELMSISGIGQKTYDRLKDLVAP